MKSYRVLLYTVVWVRSQIIESASPRKAAKQAQATLTNDTLGRLLNREFSPGGAAVRAEYAEQIESILVDELDDKGETVAEHNLCSDGWTLYSAARDAMIKILSAHPDREEATRAAAMVGGLTLLPEVEVPQGDDPNYDREDWRQEVSENNTQLGYWEWVAHRRESDLANQG